jgi:hypothetical protein
LSRSADRDSRRSLDSQRVRRRRWEQVGEIRKPSASSALQTYEFQEHLHLAVLFDGMTQGLVSPDAIDVPSPLSNVRQIPCSFELGDDLLHGAFRNPYSRGYVADPNVRIIRDTDEYVSVIREERPRTSGLTRLRSSRDFARIDHGLTHPKTRITIRVLRYMNQRTSEPESSPTENRQSRACEKGCNEFAR